MRAYWTKGRMLSGGMPLRPLHVVTQRENNIGEHKWRIFRDVEARLARSPLCFSSRSWATMTRSASSTKKSSLTKLYQ